jgi:uncharacterized protein YecA (UPF0149 family)
MNSSEEHNEPCGCGSGKKHKDCCGAPQGEVTTMRVKDIIPMHQRSVPLSCHPHG